MTAIVTLAELTKSPDLTCDLALRICRLASLSEDVPDCVIAFANEAMNLALSEGIRSELKEAIRLLVINDIIRRYCGHSAREFFNLSDIRLASRLLDFVCTHVNSPNVLIDALVLCDAFTHLSKIDACALIVQRMISSTMNISPSSVSNANSMVHLVELHHRMLAMELNEFHNNRSQFSS
jgi:hypothetical protein